VAGQRDLDEPKLSVELEFSGEVIEDGIISYSLNSEFMTPTDGWEFTVYSEDDPAALRRKFRPLHPVKLYIDGQQQVVGRIDGTRGRGRQLTVHGRDYIADVCDGGNDPSLRFNKGMSLEAAILEVVKPWGIQKLQGTNLNRALLTGKSKFSSGKAPRDFAGLKMEDLKPSENMGAYEILERIIARHGFTAQPAGKRSELSIVAPDYQQGATFRLERGVNMLDGECDRDYSRVPTVTMARGRRAVGVTPEAVQVPLRQQFTTVFGMRTDNISTFGSKAPSKIGQNPEVRNYVSSSPGVDGQQGFPDFDVVIDDRWPKKGRAVPPGNNGLLYRPMYYQDKESRNLEQLNRGLKRMVADRLKPTLAYIATIRGHRDPASGAFFAVDTIAHVVDEIEDVNELLWVGERTFENRGGGPVTMLKLYRPESFVL
jgi:hypothetical protein